MSPARSAAGHRPGASQLQDPIVVIGMHRSGTTLVAQILRELGVFMGSQRDRYEESLFHQHLNRQLLLATGATWAQPWPFVCAVSNVEYQAWATAIIDKWYRSSAYRSLYLGRTTPARKKRVESVVGWKDPRNTFTAPLWELAHGQIRIVHVLRHGLDVANSLANRQKRDVASRRIGAPERRRKLLTGRGMRLRDGISFGMEDPLAGIELWRTYVDQARAVMNKARGATYELRFEDLLERPEPVVSALIDELALEGVEWEGGLERRLTLDERRAFAYRSIPEGLDVTRVREMLKPYGYEL